MVLDYVRNVAITSAIILYEIKFTSKIQTRDRKENSTLKKLVDRYSTPFSEYQWNIQYNFQNQETHCLTFTNNTKAKGLIDNFKSMVQNETVDWLKNDKHGVKVNDLVKLIKHEQTPNKTAEKNRKGINRCYVLRKKK
eukprot:229001_1